MARNTEGLNTQANGGGCRHDSGGRTKTQTQTKNTWRCFHGSQDMTHLPVCVLVLILHAKHMARNVWKLLFIPMHDLMFGNSV